MNKKELIGGVAAIKKHKTLREDVHVVYIGDTPYEVAIKSIIPSSCRDSEVVYGIEWFESEHGIIAPFATYNQFGVGYYYYGVACPDTELKPLVLLNNGDVDYI